MASITFSGLGSSTVVEMDDAALMAVIEAVNMLELGKMADEPGLFVIKKAIAGWEHSVKLYQETKARKVADEAVAIELAKLRESVNIIVDGEQETKPEKK